MDWNSSTLALLIPSPTPSWLSPWEWKILDHEICLFCLCLCIICVLLSSTRQQADDGLRAAKQSKWVLQRIANDFSGCENNTNMLVGLINGINTTVASRNKTKWCLRKWYWISGEEIMEEIKVLLSEHSDLRRLVPRSVGIRDALSTRWTAILLESLSWWAAAHSFFNRSVSTQNWYSIYQACILRENDETEALYRKHPNRPHSRFWHLSHSLNDLKVGGGGLSA